MIAEPPLVKRRGPIRAPVVAIAAPVVAAAVVPVEEGVTVCCICYDGPCDTAPVPCGHMSFCHACIIEHHRRDPLKGCPICDKEIVMITRIYMPK